MPNQPKTPLRAFRIDDERWNQLVAQAAAEESTASDLVREGIDRVLRDRAQRAARRARKGAVQG